MVPSGADTICTLFTRLIPDLHCLVCVLCMFFFFCLFVYGATTECCQDLKDGYTFTVFLPVLLMLCQDQGNS